jgi:hypothetical protein
MLVAVGPPCCAAGVLRVGRVSGLLCRGLVLVWERRSEPKGKRLAFA